MGWNTPIDTDLDTPQWVSRAVDLSAYAGQEIRIRFAFDTVDANFNSYEGWYVDNVKVIDAAPALLANSQGPGAMNQGELLTPQQSRLLLAEALARWQADDIDTSALGSIDIRVANFGGLTPGLADEARRTGWLDANAAGWGWFVDSTPWDDSAFTTPGNQGGQKRMGLLRVPVHEVGHLLCEGHGDGVMSETLSAGSRLAASPGPEADNAELACDAVFGTADLLREIASP